MPSSVAPPIPVSEFAAVVRRRSWDWLAALQRRLNVDRLQILNEQGSPVVPEASAAWVVTLRAPEVVSAVARALQSKMPESVRLGDLQLACVGLFAGQTRGAMVLARTVNEATVAKSRAELELIGTWLRPAVEAHLGSTQPDTDEQVPRVSSLLKVLNAAASSGSEATLLRLYANALAIWHDIDMRAYVEDVEGNFRLDIALPGAPASEVPTILNGGEISIGSDLVRLTGHDLELLGFSPIDEGMAARLVSSTDGTEWLLVLSGGIDSAGDARLTLYTDILRQALQSVADASLLATERAMCRHLVTATDQVSAAAEAALRELCAAVGGKSAALSISTPQNGRKVRVGDVKLLDDVGTSRSDRLTTTARIDEGGVVQLAIREPARQFFTSRDQRILETAGRLLASWAGGVLRRAPSSFERRAVTRSFEDVLEQVASQSAAQGASVSVVVLRLSNGQSDSAQRLAASLRSNLRAGEPVGLLNGSEIGLLLYDCTADLARSVIGRLRQAVDDREKNAFTSATVGIADCAPGAVARQLVRAAREDATAHEATR
jgi:hypothetical protein